MLNYIGIFFCLHCFRYVLQVGKANVYIITKELLCSTYKFLCTNLACKVALRKYLAFYRISYNMIHRCISEMSGETEGKSGKVEGSVS